MEVASYHPLLPAETELLEYPISPRVAGFAELATALALELYAITPSNELAQFIQYPDETKEYLFRKGTGDQEFTWQFASYIAVQVAYRLEKDGLLAEADVAQLTLGDWADMIGSEWFGSLLHDMAIAAPGTYRELGSSSTDYIYSATDMPTPHREQEVWGKLPDKLFETAIATAHTSELEEASPTPTAMLTPAFRQALRQSVRLEGYSRDGEQVINGDLTSMGCPMVRHGFEIEARYRPSFEELAKRGLVAIIEKRGKTFAVQVLSPIDRYLQLFAQLLTDIDRVHGTPTLQEDGSVTYAQYPKTNIFAGEPASRRA